ncbi:MAG TPA: histidine kinase [Terriglobales bacterium]|nr:histidine kinase [Terriglobales bacterium]
MRDNEERTTAAPRREARYARRVYWLCQSFGWLAYGIFYYLAILVPFGARGWRTILADAAYCGGGLLGTHLLQRQMQRRGWPSLGIWRLLPRLAASAILLGIGEAVLLQGVLILAVRAYRWHDLPAPWAISGSMAFGSAILIGLWLALYFAGQAMLARQHLEVEALSLRLSARESQWRELQAQLNPHFLFNSLNSLRALIGEDPGRAQAMVTRLAELLRYTLRADRTSSVALAEELAVVDDYLELEAVRFEERLRIRRDIAAEALEARVPPMLVQGLVENALKHGIARLPRGGELRLAAAVRAGCLHVEVVNSGGLAPARPGGVGLANARERLRLLYGAGARLTLEESAPGETRAALTLPYQRAESACGR